MDIERAIRTAVDTGKVEFGSHKALKRAMLGTAKVLVISTNCPPEAKADLLRYASISGVRIILYPGTGLELGTVCGKPFTIGALSVVEAGDSNILDAADGAGV
jgi:large subunit ribosomal protein L30e